MGEFTFSQSVDRGIGLLICLLQAVFQVITERGVIGELFQCQVIDLDRFTPLFRFDEPFCPLVPGDHGISCQVPVLILLERT
jgi:hypothetical protein